jgi:predicted GIY-YIG superfamily endonuclease
MLDQLAYQLPMAEAWVYMLRCADGSLYTGWTVDVPRRLARHQAGTASRYTASRLPVELAWLQEMPDRRAARQKETLIKQLGRGEKLALLAGGNQRSAAAAFLERAERRTAAPTSRCASTTCD